MPVPQADQFPLEECIFQTMPHVFHFGKGMDGDLYIIAVIFYNIGQDTYRHDDKYCKWVKGRDMVTWLTANQPALEKINDILVSGTVTVSLAAPVYSPYPLGLQLTIVFFIN